MSQANPHQLGDYAMLILLHGATVNTLKEFDPEEVVTSTKAAFDLYFQKGVPNHIVLRSGVNMRGSDELDGLKTLVRSIEDGLKTLEGQYVYLESPIIVSFEDPDNSAELQTLAKRLQHASKDHQQRPVMDRRHNKVMMELAGAWETFMRTGLWGNCIDCPKTQCIGVFTVYPELCKYIGRHDHNLKADDLFARYKDRMERPYK